MNLYKEFNKENSFSLDNPPLIPAQESWPPVDIPYIVHNYFVYTVEPRYM